MISNLTSNVYNENPVSLDSPEVRISDYNTIAGKYQDSVIQAYGKGILNGFDDGAFHGDQTLTRAQAAAVVVRTGWVGANNTAMINGSTLTDAGRTALFGDPNKTYFTGSEANLSDYIVTIQVRTWDINSANEKYTRTWNLQVNKAVAEEVKAIFEEIYNDPEQFPIHALGGARYTDTLRHSWGCAIDINPVENFYCYTTTDPYTAVTGTTCFKYSDSEYCITPDSSVVRAFAKYGWGWGGGTAENNYSGWSTTADYMHFSVRHDGG